MSLYRFVSKLSSWDLLTVTIDIIVLSPTYCLHCVKIHSTFPYNIHPPYRVIHLPFTCPLGLELSASINYALLLLEDHYLTYLLVGFSKLSLCALSLLPYQSISSGSQFKPPTAWYVRMTFMYLTSLIIPHPCITIFQNNSLRLLTISKVFT